MTGNVSYREAAQKAMDFVLQDIVRGGTTDYAGCKIVFQEYTNLSTVLNEWIFECWGLYDYVIASNDNGKYKRILDKSLETLIESLPLFYCFKVI